MYYVNYSLLGFCLFSKQDDFHISGKEIFIKVANRVSLSIISDGKIMTSLFHFAPTIRLSHGKRYLIPYYHSFSRP